MHFNARYLHIIHTISKYVQKPIWFFISIIFLSFLIGAKPPELTQRDTKNKIQEILKAHVSHHELNEEIVKRAFINYIDEIDPGKTYLIENEVIKWIEPSFQLLQDTLSQMQRGDYSTFGQLHDSLQPMIDRREKMELAIEQLELPKNIQSADFKDLAWAENETTLQTRIQQIRALQIEAAAKFEDSIRDQFWQRLNKRRMKREEELFPENPKTREKVVLSLVLKSVSQSLDSQTNYFTPSEANQFMIQVQQRLFGIGAQLRDDLNGFRIMRLLDGSPALEGNKLKINDRIIGVNNEPVVGMDIIEAVELIRGPKGSNVKLTLLREFGEGESKREEKFDIDIKRGEIVLTETRLDKSYEPFGDGVIGVIHLHSFYQDNETSSADDIRLAIEELKKEHNLKGIILDLRDNAGGLLPQAVSVTGLFIKKGIVVSVKDNTGQVQHLRNVDGKRSWDGPLVCLTSKTSASAAEIVAQTLQDYGRAIVVGDPRTYGKGTFQTFTLESANYGRINPKGEYKVTRGRYYTVSGKSPQLVGVKPDIIVPGLFSELEIGEQYSKYPLENEVIPPNFEDDFSDIPPMHRNQIIRLYKFNLQTIMTTYNPYFEILKKNSERRIEQNKNYQNFIKEISKQDHLSETAESYGMTDLQLIETSNIMKDLILLMQEERDTSTPAAA